MRLQEDVLKTNNIKMNSSELEYIYEELLEVFNNVKAEAIIAELQKNTSIKDEDLVIENKSTFRRSHRRDIINIGSIDEGILNINLSRNGLYDHLPEGLFHSKDTSKGRIAYPELRKSYKKEEQEARHFFSPLENEFFYQKLKIENKEQDLFNNFINLEDEFLIDFWKVDSSIPKKYLSKLIKLLPFAYKIAGDLELTRLCLEEVLNLNVKILKKYSPNTIDSRISNNDDNHLGTNFTLTNDQDTISQPFLNVEIGPIQESSIEEFIKKDGVTKFLNVFYNYFFPVEVEIKTTYKVNHQDGFLLNREKEPIIGLSTVI